MTAALRTLPARVLRTLGPLLLFVGCNPDPGESSAAVRVGGADEWSWSDTATSTAFDAAAFLADLTTVIEAAPAYRTQPLFDSYAAARLMGEPPCPAEDSLDADGVLNTWWYGACVSDTDVHFNGVMTAWAWSGVDISGLKVNDIGGITPSGFLYTGHGFEGRIDIYDAAATGDFSCSCEAVSVEAASSDGRELKLDYVRGPASWTGPEAAGTWLERTEVRASMAFWADSDPRGTAWALHLQLDESGLGERYRSATMVLDMALDPARQTCVSVAGNLRIRDALTAEWYDLEVGGGESGSCPMCVEVEGQSVCADLAPIVTEANARWW